MFWYISHVNGKNVLYINPSFGYKSYDSETFKNLWCINIILDSDKSMKLNEFYDFEHTLMTIIEQHTKTLKYILLLRIDGWVYEHIIMYLTKLSQHHKYQLITDKQNVRRRIINNIFTEINNNIDPMLPYNLVFDLEYTNNPVCQITTKKNWALYAVSVLDDNITFIANLPDSTRLNIKIGFGLEILYNNNKQFRSTLSYDRFWFEKLQKIPHTTASGGVGSFLFVIMPKDKQYPLGFCCFEKLATYTSGILNQYRMFLHESDDEMFFFNKSKSVDDVYFTKCDFGNIKEYYTRIDDDGIIACVRKPKFKNEHMPVYSVTKFGELVVIQTPFDELRKWGTTYMPPAPYTPISSNCIDIIPNFSQRLPIIRYIQLMHDTYGQQVISNLFPGIEKHQPYPPYNIGPLHRGHCNIRELDSLLPKLDAILFEFDRYPLFVDGIYPLTKYLALYLADSDIEKMQSFDGGKIFPRLHTLELFGLCNERGFSHLVSFLLKFNIKKLIIHGDYVRIHQTLSSHSQFQYIKFGQYHINK